MVKLRQLVVGFPANVVQGGGLLLGFAAGRRSLIGKHMQKSGNHIILRKLLPLLLISIFAVAVIIPNLSLAANLGGIPSLNVIPDSLKVEVATKISVKVPVETIYISQGFSWHHSGMDLVARTGTSVYPIMDGVVMEAISNWLGYGKYVVVDHGGGFTSLYAHFSKIYAKAGDKVTTATIIGEAGSTGFSTGPHVHLEVRHEGKVIDPAEILPTVVITN